MGFANRALLLDRVTHALELHRRDRRPLAVIFLDLDGFKAVNDTLGHSAGDDLLRQASLRFRDVLSDADTLARFGGDEFAVLLEDRTNYVETARALLASLKTPFDLGGRQMSVLASIGVANVDIDDLTPSVDDLLARADLAMYVVKGRGKADVSCMPRGCSSTRLTMWRSAVLWSRRWRTTRSPWPTNPSSTCRPGGWTLWRRWRGGRRRGRPLPPEVLVRVAERSDLIDSLFRHVLTMACKQLAGWTTLPGHFDLRVAVNVSSGQLTSPGLPLLVADELARHGLAAERLVLEINETSRLADSAHGQMVCHELRRLGVRLSVDDFGTGLSSMARLRDLPIDEVKIERAFVADVDVDDTRRRFVSGVLAFAERVGLTVIAEGVEREAECDALTELGCHRAQGFLFSAPVSAEAVTALLRSPGTWRRGHVQPEGSDDHLHEAVGHGDAGGIAVDKLRH